MLQYSSNSLFQGMFGSSDVLHSQIHVALITRFLGTHAQIQQKIQLHAQTSVVVIKRAQNKKSEKKAYQNCKNWPPMQWNLTHGQNQHKSMSIPSPAQPPRGVNQWVLPGPWLGLHFLEPYSSSTGAESSQSAGSTSQLAIAWARANVATFWRLAANMGQCWDAEGKAPNRPKCYGHRNGPGERRNCGKSCSWL